MVDTCYNPVVELIGDIGFSLGRLRDSLRLALQQGGQTSPPWDFAGQRKVRQLMLEELQAHKDDDTEGHCLFPALMMRMRERDDRGLSSNEEGISWGAAVEKTALPGVKQILAIQFSRMRALSSSPLPATKSRADHCEELHRESRLAFCDKKAAGQLCCAFFFELLDLDLFPVLRLCRENPVASAMSHRAALPA